MAQVLGGEGAREAEVVLELLAVVLAADVDLGLGPQALDGIGQHVLGAVADELAGLRALGGEDAERPARASGRRRSTFLPSSSAPMASFARRGPIVGGHAERRGAGGHRADGPVGQGQADGLGMVSIVPLLKRCKV